jgi:hypothetical protein
VVINGNLVGENRVLTHQNLALAIVAAEQNQQEQNSGYVNRSLQESLDQAWLENQRQCNIIHDLEHCLANNDANLISQLQDYIDSLEESTEVGLCDEIRWLEGTVNRKNISSISNPLNWERSCNYSLMKENCHLYDEIRCDVCHLEMYSTPDIRPAARCVSKARPLSQDQQDTDLAVRHLSVLMQDCWSQDWTVHSYIRGWYQTERHLRIPRRSIDISIEIYRHLWGDFTLDCLLDRSFLMLIFFI